MAKPKAPRTFDEFVRHFPELGKAWDVLGRAGRSGPLPPKTCELVKLGSAIASRSEGAVHSAVRKARAAGASVAELQQVLVLSASTVGLPWTVAAYTWMRDELGVASPRAKRKR
jgi:alkylhydroperoxidase/carboxymuconolactone decarboxylase family protein YurZ